MCCREKPKTSPLVFVDAAMDVVPSIDEDYTRYDIEEEAGGSVTQATWHVEIQGTCVKVKVLDPHSIMPIKTKGADCGPMSKGAMMRMLRFMNKIDWTRITEALFITLTYRDDMLFERKRDRNTHRFLFMRFIEHYLKRQVASIWRCEWKVRKTGECKGMIAPHFHIIVPMVGFVPFMAINQFWKQAAGTDEIIATDVRRVTGHQGALRYIAKYVSKDCYLDKLVYLNNGVELGRSWGVTRKHLIPMCPISVSRELTDAERDRVQLVGKNKLTWYDPADEVGYTLLGDEAVQLFQKILHLPIAKRC